MTTISVAPACLRAADGRVDLLGVELAGLLVERAVAAGLLPFDDPGAALDVADDVTSPVEPSGRGTRWRADRQARARPPPIAYTRTPTATTPSRGGACAGRAAGASGRGRGRRRTPSGSSPRAPRRRPRRAEPRGDRRTRPATWLRDAGKPQPPLGLPAPSFEGRDVRVVARLAARRRRRSARRGGDARCSRGVGAGTTDQRGCAGRARSARRARPRSADAADDVQPPADNGRAPGRSRLGQARQAAPPAAVEGRTPFAAAPPSERAAVAAGDVEAAAARGDERVVDGDGQVGQAAPATGRRRERVGPRRRTTRRPSARRRPRSRPRTTAAPTSVRGCGQRRSGQPGERGDGDLRADHRRDLPHPLAAAVRIGTAAELVAEAEERRERRAAARACSPSSTFSATPTPSGGRDADQPLGAALRDPARPQAHQVGVGRAALVADQPGVRGHRGDDPCAALDPREARERVRHPLERHPEREHAAAVDRGRDLVARRARRAAATSSSSSCCIGCVRQPVALDRPAAGAADGEEAGVLAGAVVREEARPAALLRAELEVGLRRRRAASSRLRGGLELLAARRDATRRRSRARPR